MSKPFYDLSDTDLLAWSNNFSQRLTATPAAFGITAPQALAYAQNNASFVVALNAWREPITKTPIASANKKAARQTLLMMAKYLVNSINSNPSITDAQRDELGIRARKKPSPIPAPSVSPLIDIESVSGRTVSIRLHGDAARRGRPRGVQGAGVFTAIGETAPVEIEQWKFEGLTTKTKFEITFPESASAGTVWITANWYNERGQTGLACAPVSVNLPASQIVPVTAKIKIAA